MELEKGDILRRKEDGRLVIILEVKSKGAFNGPKLGFTHFLDIATNKRGGCPTYYLERHYEKIG